jgi:hypothetical protein
MSPPGPSSRCTQHELGMGPPITGGFNHDFDGQRRLDLMIFAKLTRPGPRSSRSASDASPEEQARTELASYSAAMSQP